MISSQHGHIADSITVTDDVTNIYYPLIISQCILYALI